MPVQGPVQVVAFGVPQHGWLPVFLRLGDDRHEFEAPDVGEDCLEVTLKALLDVAAGSSTSMRWYLEPDFMEYRFEERHGATTLVVTHWSGGPDMEPIAGADTLIGTWRGSTRDLLAQFRSALAALEPVLPVEPHWPYPFPSDLQRALEARMDEPGSGA